MIKIYFNKKYIYYIELIKFPRIVVFLLAEMLRQHRGHNQALEYIKIKLQYVNLNENKK